MSKSATPIDTGLLEDLERRGLVHDTTDRTELAKRLSEGPITVYVGFDPTADSLHAGNMIGLLMLRRFQDAGHHVISLAGGATGMVGDPSGKSDERSLLDDDGLAKNLAGIVPQLRQFLDFDRDGNPAKLLDNRAWTVGVPYLTFLRDVGKHITVNHMIAKDSVKSRMEAEDGISYTEFSYMLLQANDFRWLYENEGCEMQMGGSDQWGNITLGGELIRRTLSASGMALTWPLLTKPDGTKYGKTAGGDTMWLSAEKLSPYRFFQGWMQVEDAEVSRILLQLTLLSVAEIDQIVVEHNEEPHRRIGQRRIAHELTSLVHSPEAAVAAAAASDVVFGGSVAGLDEATLVMLSGDIPTTHVARSNLDTPGNLVDLLVEAGLVKSKSEANRLLGQNGISVNDTKAQADASITHADLLQGRFSIIRKGKRHVSLLVFDR